MAPSPVLRNATPKYRVLVTGGAGFIGTHLVERLLSEGHDVVCMDNYFSGLKENLERFYGNPRFECIRHDITQDFSMEADHIYHLACPASPVHYQNNAIKTLKTNVLGTLNVLGVARRCGARVLLASTSEVYGDPLVHPQTEEYFGNVNPCGTRSCYDEGKRAAESLCMDYHRQHQVQVRIARIFNTYGPRMNAQDGRVVSNFITQALNGQNLTIYGDGSQTRSFCFVTDLVDGLIRLMNCDYVGPVNLGNPVEFTMIELANLIKGKINSNIEICHLGLPADDPTRRQPDIAKAKALLGWSPKVSLNEGLDLTIADFKERFNDSQLATWGSRRGRYLKTIKRDSSHSGNSEDSPKEKKNGDGQ
eukprot:Gregarina_sp_Poly_1__1680@NODE_1430_length_4167_cov_202_968780_g580_i2_p1_GENE_NODE_1430_length_4167_cov_202_968780_g580_i2NODE_1430_length_4167_cov_202_968780_g580_i2_p1_ORF_typecomplete_len363_score39_20GDP_Man_Dehyd/PF16363_5/8_4e88Epimerase/PF01370_21/6_4e583Beta_HSD/PF01073_19/2_5e25RmlD_sub_bind/PF04321_17/7_4e22NAD_binding_4/PF07993_12/6_4e18Polysacc_synt_2/PF02719_15/4_3e09Polysacc_synt_2/PF02719_15/0_49NAD_binding_10/PF13460_6/6e07adh_short/PF00106_25/0_00028NmrA/PF05368_13/0_02NmrA/PF0